MTNGPISESLEDELVSAARTAVGDELRSLTYFTREEYEQIYLRSDLERDADLSAFAANERLGFTSQQTYGDSELGEYLFTIRVFDSGYLTRVIVGEHGAFVTTDELHMDLFTEIASAIRGVLADHEDEVSAPD